MPRLTAATQQSSQDLASLIETLAGAICAADHPATALVSVVARLRREVQDTNETAHSHVGLRRRLTGAA